MKCLVIALMLLSPSLWSAKPHVDRWETSTFGKNKELSHVDELVQQHLGGALDVKDAVKLAHPKVNMWKIYLCYGKEEKKGVLRTVYVHWSWKTQAWEFIDINKGDNSETIRARGIPEELFVDTLLKYRGDYQTRYLKPVPKTIRKTRPAQGKIKGVAVARATSLTEETVSKLTAIYQSHNVKFAVSEPGQYGRDIYLFYEDDGSVNTYYEVPNE